jgi:NADH-quinone oxidoreductase subunit N
MDTFILKSFFPEIFLSVSIVLQLVFNSKIVNRLNFNFLLISKEILSQTVFILFCLLLIYTNLRVEGFLSNYLLINNGGGCFVKIIIVLSCFFVVNFIFKAFLVQKLNFFEFFVVFLISILSLLLLVSSFDFLSFYLVLEMQALCFYVLATFKRNSVFSTEAGLKYFISSAFISGFFLFGSSLLYICLGTLNLNNINILLSFPVDAGLTEMQFFLKIGVILITSTLLFKISCAPFHFWSPDVYEGAPISSTIIFSVVPKIAIIFFFIKWICSLNFFYLNFSNLLLVVGVFSTFLGTLFSLSQTRLKKLIIYSSISQIGFLVSGLSLNSLFGLSSVYFFILVYIATSILIWGHFVLFYSSQENVNTFYQKNYNSLYISSLINLFKTNKLWSFSIVIIFFSIAGIPPLTGFLAKIFILSELINFDNTAAAILLIFITSISVFYYIRVIKTLFFEPNFLKTKINSFQLVFFNSLLDGLYVVLALILFFLVVCFFYPTTLFLFCHYLVLSSFF